MCDSYRHGCMSPREPGLLSQDYLHLCYLGHLLCLVQSCPELYCGPEFPVHFEGEIQLQKGVNLGFIINRASTLHWWWGYKLMITYIYMKDPESSPTSFLLYSHSYFLDWGTYTYVIVFAHLVVCSNYYSFFCGGCHWQQNGETE